jgi:hypothetical protein
LVALLLFHGPIERARAAESQLQAGGWDVSVSVEDEPGEGHLLEATRSVAWKDLSAVQDDAEELATRLGADDCGTEVALPPR